MLRQIPAIYRRRVVRRDQTTGRGATGRALLTGGLLAALIAIGVPYGGMVVQGSRLGLSSATPAAFFLLFVLLLTVQVGLGAVRREWAFGRGELLTIFAMMAVATAIPTRGVVGLLLPMITGTFYYATPENQWAELIHPHLANWMVVADIEAIRDFYEGVGRNASIPWDAWLVPLGRWLAFYAAFYLSLICLMNILRRQWVDNERLAYPLAQVPLAMVQGADESRVAPFFRQRLVWLGLAIPFVLGSLDTLNHYFPSVPAPVLGTQLSLLQQMVVLRLNVNFLMLGFAYLIGVQLSFSLWVFYLIHALQEGVLGELHLQHTAEVGAWSDAGMGHQMIGACAALVAYSLWTARAHLTEVGRRFLRPKRDEGEMASYRFSVVGLVLGTAGMVLWLWQSGLPMWIAALVVVVALGLLVALTRIIAEAGTPTITSGMIPAGFTVSAVGVPALGAPGVVALGYTLVWVGDLLVFMTAPLANSLRLGSELAGDRRRLLWGLAAAMLISLMLSTWYTLHLAYTHGAVNLHRQYFSTFATEPSKFAAQQLLHPTGPDAIGWLWTGGGALLMSTLIGARNHWAWWPLHPLGFAASMAWVMDHIWFSIFLAWFVKTLVLRFGGAALYQKTVPFFLGIALGQIVTAGVWLIIDGFTGTVGNRLPVY
ncbi:MAG: hypothetical protein F4Z85_15145 [Gemmatimonadetes bacterium]|nr:hypothetical protein [Gemmatimonadota bacterium]MYB72061.1 hypothetical protein [Gemmatimonadota bacterium]